MTTWIGRRGPRLALGAGLLLLLVLATRDADALVVPWWNIGYSSSREVTLSTGPSAIPAGTLVSVTINHAALVSAGQSLASGDDVRLVYNNSGTLSELPRVLAAGSSWNSATTRIMFKTQTSIAASSSNPNYFMYYGNAGAAAPPTAGVPTSRTYKVEQLTEQSTTSAAFVNMPGTTLTFTPAQTTETWIVFLTGVLRSTALGDDAEMRLLINGVEEDSWGHRNINSGTPNGSGFLVFKAITGTIAAQTLQVQFRSVSGANTTAADDVRIVACLLPQNADFQYSETDAATQLPKNSANAALQTLTFTPSSAGDYCIFAKAVHNDPGGGTVKTWVEDDTGGLHPDAPAGTGYANKTPARVNIATAFRKTLPASARTFTIRGTTGGNNGSIWEYRRIMAFRADAWESQEYNQSAGVTSNIDGALLIKNSLTTAAPPAARDYLVVQLERMGGDNTQTLQKSGVFRDGGVELLRTNHRINLPDDTTNGYHHVAAVANVKNTAASVLYENGLQSSSGVPDSVRAADSTVLAFRWLEPTVTQAPGVRDLGSTAADGTYGVAASVPVTVRFSEPVTVTGVPQLTIETGAVDRVLTYTSGSGTNTLTFAYTVGINDTSPDLDAASAAALALAGGTIKDAAGFDANLALPAPGATGSLGLNKALVIDGIAPGAPGTPGGSPSPNNGTFTVSWTGATDFGGSGSGGVTYTVQRSFNGGAFSTIVSSLAAISLPQSGLATGNYTYRVFATDLAGNNGPLSGVSAAVVVDATPPTVVSFAPNDPLSTNLGVVSYTVTFSEAVTGVGATDFSLNTTGITGFSIGTVTGGGTTWTVPINTGSGSGTLQLAMAGAPTISDTVGNALVGPFPAAPTYTIDRTFPAVSSIVLANASPTSSASVAYTVTFSKGVSGVNAADFSVVPTGLTGVGAPVVSGGPTVYTVTVSTGTGSGTLGLNLVDDNSILDALGNPLGGAALGDGNFTGPAYTVDKTAPVVSSIAPVGPSPTAASSVGFTVTFSKAVSGVDAGDFALATTGTIAGASVGVVSGGPTVYTVTVSTGTGSGTIGLNVVDNDSIVDGVGNVLGGAGAGNGDFTGQIVTIDRNNPGVASIVRAGASPTNAASVGFTVTFSRSVTGVDSGDFALATSGISGAGITGTSGSGTTYTVTVATGSGDGTIQLNLVDNDSIIDALSNPLGGVGAGNGNFSGQIYTLDHTVPTVSSILLADPSPSNLSGVHFTVTFSESVTGVDSGDFALATSGVAGAGISGVSGAGTTYTVTVNTGTGDGTIGLNLVDNDSITDSAGNALSGAGLGNGNFTGPAYSILKTAPTLVSIVRAGASPTAAASVNFTATFSGPVSGVDAADFNLVATGVSGASVSTVSGGGSVYTVAVSTASGDGTLQLNMAAGPTITDAASNAITGPYPPGEVYTIDKTPPGISISAPSTGSTTTGPVSFTITYTGASSVTLSALDVQLNSTGGASGSVGVSGAGTASRTVTISAITGAGTLGMSIVANTAVDAVGNSALAAGPSATFTVLAPGVPDLPTALQVDGATNPTAVTRGVPDFTAVHNWTGPAPLDAVMFQIQVSQDATFATLSHWNSPAGGTPFPGAATVAAGLRSPLLQYGLGGHQGGPVPLLSWNSQYSWRIKFWDSGAAASPFSTEPATFQTDSPSTLVSANGNGDPGADSYRYLGFPIAIGTTVPASEYLSHLSFVYKWDEPTRQYIQLTAADVIEGGRGYLAYAPPGATLGLAQGSIALGDQPLSLTYTTLAAPAGPEITEGRPANYYRGAHFVCNPFNKNISWKDPPAGSVDKTNLSATYFKWDGAQYLVYNSATQLGGAGPTIAPFQAFGVNVLSATAGADMTFRDVTATPPSPKVAAPSANSWSLKLVAASGPAQDTENIVGVHPSSDDAWDSRDAEEPGHGAVTWVLLSFDHSDWTSHPRRYTHDYRKSRYNAGDEVVWTATLETNTGLPVTLTWPNIYEMPTASWAYTIEDPVAGTTTDMLQASSINVATAGGVATVRIHALRIVGSQGSLSITKTLAGPAPSTAAPGATGVPLLAIDVQAVGEPVTVGQLTVLHQGTGDPSLVQLSLYDANGKIAGPTPYTGGQVVWSGLDRTLAENEIQNWVIIADFAAGAVETSTYQVAIHAEDVTGLGGVSGKALTPTAAVLESSVVTISTNAPSGDSSGGGGGGGGSCGLIGVECLGLAVLLGGIRRIRGGRSGRK